MRIATRGLQSSSKSTRSNLGLSSKGLKLQNVVPVPSPSPDMSSYVAAATKGGTDGMALLLLGSDMIKFIQTAQQQGVTAKLSIITEKPERLRDRVELDEVRGLVAIALSTVGAVLKVEDGKAYPVAQKEIQERLFVRNGASPRFDGLCMRRIELLRAVEALRHAHIAFDRKHILEEIRKLS